MRTLENAIPSALVRFAHESSSSISRCLPLPHCHALPIRFCGSLPWRIAIRHPSGSVVHFVGIGQLSAYLLIRITCLARRRDQRIIYYSTSIKKPGSFIKSFQNRFRSSGERNLCSFRSITLIAIPERAFFTKIR